MILISGLPILFLLVFSREKTHNLPFNSGVAYVRLDCFDTSHDQTG